MDNFVDILDDIVSTGGYFCDRIELWWNIIGDFYMLVLPTW